MYLDTQKMIFEAFFLFYYMVQSNSHKTYFYWVQTRKNLENFPENPVFSIFEYVKIFLSKINVGYLIAFLKGFHKHFSEFENSSYNLRYIEKTILIFTSLAAIYLENYRSNRLQILILSNLINLQTFIADNFFRYLSYFRRYKRLKSVTAGPVHLGYRFRG